MKPCLRFRITGVVCLVLVLGLLPWTLHAQTTPPGFTHQVFTTDDGLPTNLLTVLAQTPDGYLWIGSQDGLVRYDGARFIVFNSANTEAFTNNRITQLRVSEQGDLWVLARDYSLLHYQDGRFTRLDFGGKRAHQVLTDTTGTWIATQTGLFRYDEGRLDTVAVGLWDAHVMDLIRTRDGAFWVAGQEGLVVRFKGGTAHRLLSPTPNGAVQPLALLHEAADGTVWISTAGALWRFRADRLTPVPLPLDISLNDIIALATDSEGQLLLEHEDGRAVLLAADGTSRELPPADARFRASAGRKVW